MENILQPVLESYPKFFIQKQKSPSYVQMYSKSNNDIAIVYVKNKQTSSNPASIPQKNNQVIDELDLTGSPLKLDLSLHTILDDTLISDEPQLWTKEEASHYPLNIEKAREVANFYNNSLTQVSKEESLPMWILTNPSEEGHPLLLMVHSDSLHFARGIVTYQGAFSLEDVEFSKFIEEYALQEKISADMINITLDCKFLLAGISYGSHSTDELLNAPHSGLTELRCEWSGKSLQIPYISCKVHFEQEVIIGHLASPCNAIWKSVSALHSMNQLLVDMTAAGHSSVNLETATISNIIPGAKRPDNTKRLNNLLNETEMYAYTAEFPPGGCTCIGEDTTSLKQCMAAMQARGSSNDFTYRLWDVLRDCATAEELITLLIQALKFISSGKIRPFIDANNKTYLSKLVLKLSRGHSQASKVLKNLRTSPPQALSLVAQVGVEKTMWEYTRVMSLLEHSYYIAGIWTSESRQPHGCLNKNMVLKLYRGHSQASKVLKNLRTSPPQALSLVAQVGVEKTMWEYTRVMSLLEHSYYIAGIWTSESRSHESIEQINQTIQDMTMGGDFTLNPFDTLSHGEHSIRLDCESFCVEESSELTVDDFASLKKHGLAPEKKDNNEPALMILSMNQTIQYMTMGGDFTLNSFDTLSHGEHSIRLDCESFCVEESSELTVDDFASLKKHGLAPEKKDNNEVPLIADEIDISPWKNLLMKFAQVHACLEHLYRAETCLRADIAGLKPIASRLLEHYVSEKSPVRSIGQLMSDPLQRISMPVANNLVQDHLKKNAFWYRAEMSKKEKNAGVKRDCKVVYVFSQQPVFPPPVWQNLEPSVEDAAEVTTVGEDFKYHVTKYTFLSNEVVSKINLKCTS